MADLDWLHYRFANEALAHSAFGRVTQLLLLGPGPNGWVYSVNVRRIDTGAPAVVFFRMHPGEAAILSRSEAMRWAWVEWLQRGICPPDVALGTAFTALELRALLYVLTHGLLPPGLAEATQAVLSAVGVPVPDSIPGVITGTLSEVIRQMDITLDEGLQAFEDAAHKAREAVAAARAPESAGGKEITTEEGIGIAKEAFKVALTDILGDDVPALPQLLVGIDVLVGLGLPLVLKKKAA